MPSTGKRDDQRNGQPTRDREGDCIARVSRLAHLYQNLAVTIVARKHPPAFAVDLDVVEPLALRRQAPVGGVRRVHPQGFATLPDLKGDTARVAVELRRVFEIGFVEVVSGLRDEQRSGLCEVAIQEFVGFVPCVAVGEHGRADPRERDNA